MRYTAVLKEPDHRGHAHGNAGGVQEVAVLLFGHGHAFKNEHEGAARSADIDRLVRGVQDKHRRVQGISIAVAMRRRGWKEPGGMSRRWSCLDFAAAPHHGFLVPDQLLLALSSAVHLRNSHLDARA